MTENWTPTFEKATPLHIGPCSECDRYREALEEITKACINLSAAQTIAERALAAPEEAEWIGRR